MTMCFFFSSRRRHTRWTGDWSSDVCSSDLVGLYGVMAYSVARRSRESGIKLALGAARSSVLWHVLRDTFVVSATGIAIGLFTAVVLAQSVAAVLFGLEPRDPLTLAGSAAVLLVTTLVAGYLPARKAAGVDPMRALRTE